MLRPLTLCPGDGAQLMVAEGDRWRDTDRCRKRALFSDRHGRHSSGRPIPRQLDPLPGTESRPVQGQHLPWSRDARGDSQAWTGRGGGHVNRKCRQHAEHEECGNPVRCRPAPWSGTPFSVDPVAAIPKCHQVIPAPATPTRPASCRVSVGPQAPCAVRPDPSVCRGPVTAKWPIRWGRRRQIVIARGPAERRTQ